MDITDLTFYTHYLVMYIEKLFLLVMDFHTSWLLPPFSILVLPYQSPQLNSDVYILYYFTYHIYFSKGKFYVLDIDPGENNLRQQ